MFFSPHTHRKNCLGNILTLTNDGDCREIWSFESGHRGIMFYCLDGNIVCTSGKRHGTISTQEK